MFSFALSSLSASFSHRSVQPSWHMAHISSLLLLFILVFEDELQHVRNSHQHSCTFPNISERKAREGFIRNRGVALKLQSRARLYNLQYSFRLCQPVF